MRTEPRQRLDGMRSLKRELARTSNVMFGSRRSLGCCGSRQSYGCNMVQTTITEALAELKTIDKRIEKKREFILSYLLRQEIFKDPLEKEGGSVSAIRRELQSIHDLEERRIGIRRAIQLANQTTMVTVGKQTRSIADWLVWRREVAPRQTQFLASIRMKIEQSRQEAVRRGAGLASNTETARPSDVIVNINEQDRAREIEAMEEALGQLDGLLSLKNATIIIEV